MLCNVVIKYVSLVLMLIQNSGFVLMMRYSRQQQQDSSAEQYSVAVVIVLQEFFKLVLCLLVIAATQGRRAAFEALGWWGVPDPTVHGVVADVLRDGKESLEGAVAEAIERQGASLRRAAYNRRVRETVITKYQERFKRQRFMPIDADEDAAEGEGEGAGGAPLDLVAPQGGSSSNVQG